MEADELTGRIAAFPRWNYRFEFANGVSTPIYDSGLAARQSWRYGYLFERLLQACGGSLRGYRVLDLGCNAGFWSLSAIEAGADFVSGIDVQREFVEQARLVFEAKGVDPERYLLREGDLFTEPLGECDVVLCLGVVDQLDRPSELFELMAATGARLMLIDTSVSRSRASIFETTRLYGPAASGANRITLLPSRAAVADLAARRGFATVALAQHAPDRAGMNEYRRERRCGFLCYREIAVGDLPAERRPRIVPWWIRHPRALIRS